MRRGAIWWASLPDPNGSGPGYRRPVIIVQADSFNVSKIRTVIVVPLTTNLRLADAPGNFLLPQRSSMLPRDSVVNVSQLITVDRDYLTEYITELPPKAVRALDEGLRLVLDLDR